MHSAQNEIIKIPSDNADIEFILGLFDKQELGLTIVEDNEENEKKSPTYLSNLDSTSEMTDIKYKAAFTTYFKKNRKQAISFVDAAIRFMNGLKKMKIEDLLVYVSEPKAYNQILQNFITPELLIDPIEEELMTNNLSKKDKSLYEEVLKLLKSQEELARETKQKIRRLLEQIESN